MFSTRQIAALALALSSASAACVPRDSGSETTPTSAAVASDLPVQAVSASASSSAAAAPAATASSSASASGDGTKYLAVFGDSYSSTGFYIEGGFPTASNPMGSGGSTTTGGLNWVGMVTEQLNSSLVLTYDFAVYGADISNDIINTGVTTDVIAQVGQFEDNLVPAPTEAPWTAEDMLVAVWIGVNDIGQCFWKSAQYESCPIDEALTKYFDLMQNLYKDGVRNFVLNTVPPFYKAPAFNDQSEDSLKALTTNLDSFNSKLATKLDAFKSSNTGVTAQTFNTSSYFWEVFNDPTSFGLDSDITAANADGTSAVWYDNYHPGQAIHKLVAKGFVAALADFF
ncbi:hypothetical protein INS49_003992 [Diaporthe citri]|uniref:uncharacterized protein n=1 Tax=Diaporthe citri TaxID=83186 RepID=UPI001C7E51A2|nr:uncharacterized protein INS49_003992 [Diaporthe citri]KAG6354911.1 hypothetical protein INS49_003992 [Diaporthe citri]